MIADIGYRAAWILLALIMAGVLISIIGFGAWLWEGREARRFRRDMNIPPTSGTRGR